MVTEGKGEIMCVCGDKIFDKKKGGITIRGRI